MHPVGKKLCVESKNEGYVFDGHDELYHHAKFGGDRTMRAGCRCENVVFFVCLFVTLRVRSTVHLRAGCRCENVVVVFFAANCRY